MSFHVVFSFHHDLIPLRCPLEITLPLRKGAMLVPFILYVLVAVSAGVRRSWGNHYSCLPALALRCSVYSTLILLKGGVSDQFWLLRGRVGRTITQHVCASYYLQKVFRCGEHGLVTNYWG